MKSIQNLLRSVSEKNQVLNSADQLKVKGGNGIIVETVIDITTTVGGATSLIYCDRRRRRVG